MVASLILPLASLIAASAPLVFPLKTFLTNNFKVHQHALPAKRI
jgi:hypothetical protein